MSLVGYNSQYNPFMETEVETLAYYFSTHGCSLSCFGSVGFCLELLVAAAAAARALLLKKVEAMTACVLILQIRGPEDLVFLTELWEPPKKDVSETRPHVIRETT